MPWTAYFSGCRVSGFGIMNGLTIWMYNVKKRTVVANMVNPKGPVTSSGTRPEAEIASAYSEFITATM